MSLQRLMALVHFTQVCVTLARQTLSFVKFALDRLFPGPNVPGMISPRGDCCGE
jgi:hypothetical protein